MNGDRDRDEGIRKLAEMILGIRVAMLTTETSTGVLRSRPMVTQEIEFDGDLWFFTGAQTPKVDEIGINSRINVGYADPERNRYVSISGRASLVRDPARAKSLWTPTLGAWFPNGPDDPDVTLIRIVVEQAEYWDVASNRFRRPFVDALVEWRPHDPPTL